MRRKLNGYEIESFAAYLRREERSEGTVSAYLANVHAFAKWLGDGHVTKEAMVAWKDELAQHYAPATVNVKLAAVNAFFKFCGWQDCCVKALRLQRRVFRDPGRDLTKAEYEKLVAAAKNSGRTRLALLMETICGTGIRVSEVQYITIEAALAGRAEIALKGKIRTIMLPGKLCRKLLKYARKNKIASGEIFLTRSGKSLSRRTGKGVSPQPAAPVCHDVLPSLPRYREAGGCLRALQHQYDADIPHHHRRGTRQDAGAVRFGQLAE